MILSPTTCITALWAAWLIVWMLAARSTAPTVTRQAPASLLVHSTLLLVGVALLFLHPRWFGIFLRPVLPQSGWIPWGGVVIVALGIGFAGWARAHLGRFWSSAIEIKAEHTLIRTGPYTLTRHPIYTGLLLAVIGTALARGTIGALAGLALVVLGGLLRMHQEEKLLLEHFGNAYRVYQVEVPAVFPRLRFSKRSASI